MCAALPQYLLSCFPANSCPPKIKFARKKGHSTKERNHCQLVSFFYVMPFEDNDPAPTLPLGVTARQFSACYNLNGIASRLIYSYTQFNQFINQLSYSVVPAPFQVHVLIIYPLKGIVKRMFTYFSGKSKKFSELSTIQRRNGARS